MLSTLLQEQLRLDKLLAEESQLTFKPSITEYPEARPHLSLRNPEVYLASVRAKEQQRMAEQLEKKRLEEVNREC